MGEVWLAEQDKPRRWVGPPRLRDMNTRVPGTFTAPLRTHQDKWPSSRNPHHSGFNGGPLGPGLTSS